MEEQVKTLVVEEENISFIRRKGELTKLLKTVDKISPDAVKLLENTMADEKVDIKVRVACAKELLGINIEVAKLVNQDNLQRMVAQIKLKPKGSRNLVDNESVEDDLPELDFSTVKSV